MLGRTPSGTSLSFPSPESVSMTGASPAKPFALAGGAKGLSEDSFGVAPVEAPGGIGCVVEFSPPATLGALAGSSATEGGDLVSNGLTSSSGAAMPDSALPGAALAIGGSSTTGFSLGVSVTL